MHNPPDEEDGKERRSSDRHRPRSGRNSWASLRRMAPPSKGMARRQRRARTPLSPSSFRVPAMWRDGAGSFAACGRDAGLKTGAPRSWHLGIFMPGGVRKRTRAWAFAVKTQPEGRKRLGTPTSGRHAARRAATTYRPRAEWRWQTASRQPRGQQVRVRPPPAGGADRRSAFQAAPPSGRVGLRLRQAFSCPAGCAGEQGRFSRFGPAHAVLRAAHVVTLLTQGGAHGLERRPLVGTRPGGPQPRTAPGPNGAGRQRRANLAGSKYAFARLRRAVPTGGRRSKPSPPSGRVGLRHRQTSSRRTGCADGPDHERFSRWGVFRPAPRPTGPRRGAVPIRFRGATTGG